MNEIIPIKYNYNKEIKDILNKYNISKDFSFYYVPDTQFNIAILYTDEQNFKDNKYKMIPGSRWKSKEIDNSNINNVFIIDINYKSLLSFKTYEEFSQYLAIIIRKVS